MLTLAQCFLQSPTTQDEIVMVRVAYAENIAMLAETALRFLEMVQLDQTTTQTHGGSQDFSVQYQVGVTVKSVNPKSFCVFCGKEKNKINERQHK